MGRQGGRVQLEQSDMRLALNMAKMAKKDLSRAAIEETQYRIKKPSAQVREEKKRDVEFPGLKKVKAVIERHPAMLRQNQTSGCQSCHNGTTKNAHACWRRKGPDALPPARRREPSPEPTPSSPVTLPAPTDNTSGAQPSEIVNMPAGYMYSNTAPPGAEIFDDDEETKHDAHFDPDMLADEG
jgi:hypothetical protein